MHLILLFSINLCISMLLEHAQGLVKFTCACAGIAVRTLLSELCKVQGLQSRSVKAQTQRLRGSAQQPSFVGGQALLCTTGFVGGQALLCTTGQALLCTTGRALCTTGFVGGQALCTTGLVGGQAMLCTTGQAHFVGGFVGGQALLVLSLNNTGQVQAFLVIPLCVCECVAHLHATSPLRVHAIRGLENVFLD